MHKLLHKGKKGMNQEKIMGKLPETKKRKKERKEKEL